MEKFEVKVTETSYGFVEVEAGSSEEARDKAENEYYLGNVIWRSSELTTITD